MATAAQVYIIKFSDVLGNRSNPRGQAQYYVGVALDGDVQRRFEEHKTGQGAKICAAAVQQGMCLEIVLTLPGDRKVERAIKNRKNTRLFVERYLKAQAVIVQ